MTWPERIVPGRVAPSKKSTLSRGCAPVTTGRANELIWPFFLLPDRPTEIGSKRAAAQLMLARYRPSWSWCCSPDDCVAGARLLNRTKAAHLRAVQVPGLGRPGVRSQGEPEGVGRRSSKGGAKGGARRYRPLTVPEKAGGLGYAAGVHLFTEDHAWTVQTDRAISSVAIQFGVPLQIADHRSTDGVDLLPPLAAARFHPKPACAVV